MIKKHPWQYPHPIFLYPSHLYGYVVIEGRCFILFLYTNFIFLRAWCSIKETSTVSPKRKGSISLSNFTFYYYGLKIHIFFSLLCCYFFKRIHFLNNKYLNFAFEAVLPLFVFESQTVDCHN